MIEHHQKYLYVLLKILSSAKDKDYSGFSKFDALNSPFLKTLSFDNKWLKLIYTQAVNRLPFNIRPFLGVNQSRNPKGIALFSRAYLSLYEFTKERKYLVEADRLLEWLVENSSPGYRNLCWGYNFEWQNTIFLQKMHSPNVVVTTNAGEAFIHAYRVTGNIKYLQYAESVLAFILNDVPVLEEADDEMAINYVLSETDAIVLNINSMAGAFIIKMWKELGQPELRNMAEKLLNHTANRRTEYFAWYYTDPADKSPIRHDNYHTGYILDAFLDFFEETGSDRFQTIYWNGLEFYFKNLFENDGAPRWMSDKKHPHDIHGSAQGIITFARAAEYEPAYIDRAITIANWTIENLYRQKTGDFSYRIGKYLKWNYSLMRWCNAWMARAFGELILK